MYQRIHDNVPEIVRPHTKYNSRTELVFDELDSALRVATAGGRGVARGETLTFAHLSEVAFWPQRSRTELQRPVQAVPEEDDTFVFLESTAQGVTGKFYEMYQASHRPDRHPVERLRAVLLGMVRERRVPRLPLPLTSSEPPRKRS
jgi:hypothetical protein